MNDERGEERNKVSFTTASVENIRGSFYIAVHKGRVFQEPTGLFISTVNGLGFRGQDGQNMQGTDKAEENMSTGET